MPYQHESLCPRHESVQKYIDHRSCVYCQVINSVRLEDDNYAYVAAQAEAKAEAKWQSLHGKSVLGRNEYERGREDERSKTLKAASEALDVLDRWGEATYRHVVIDYDEAVAAIESLGDEDD
jgi:hypothetical protein